MARPPNVGEVVRITISESTKFAQYLDDLIALGEGYGSSRAEVAKSLAWNGIHNLIERGLLDRRSVSRARRAAVGRRLSTSKGRTRNSES